MSEISLQRYFKREAAKHHLFWRKVRWEGNRGCPDVFIAHRGRIMFIELKTPDQSGKLSGKQAREIDRLKAAGVEVQVFDNKEGIDAAIRDITGA